MIQLNKTNGQIIVGDIEITSSFTLIDIQNLKARYDVKLAVENAGYSSYYIQSIDDDESSVFFMFFSGKLLWISIGMGKKYNLPPFVLTQNGRHMLNRMIASLGGEKSYPWGSIKFSEDSKGGSASIMINYT